MLTNNSMAELGDVMPLFECKKLERLRWVAYSVPPAMMLSPQRTGKELRQRRDISARSLTSPFPSTHP